MRSMGKCETRECSRVRERRRRRRGQAVVPDDDGIAPLSIYYCLRGQATRRFGPHPHRDVDKSEACRRTKGRYNSTCRVLSFLMRDGTGAIRR